MLTKEYRDYLRSDEWKRKRWGKLWEAGNKCERCGKAEGLDVHHKHYDTLGREDTRDLAILCRDCHEKADVSRRFNARRKAAVNTYMTKKHGEDWQHWFEPAEAYDEFERWAEYRDM